MENKTAYNLFLDDDPQRIPHKLSWISLPLVEWTIVRDYDAFVKMIEERGVPNIVSFDHDLRDPHYQEYHRAKETNTQLDYSRITKTGYHAAVFLAEYCIEHNIPIPEYYAHTWNDKGKANICSVMESAKKVMYQKISDTLL